MNPYRLPRPGIVPFSGGRTSGYLLRQVINAYNGKLPEDIVIAFCNTGEEHLATLDFVHEVEVRWGHRVYWLEFDTRAEHRTRIVDYALAARHGEPLAAVVESRPTQHLFNPVSRYCSATAKARRMQKLMHAVLGFDEWNVALGLRADEMHRVEKARKRSGRDREIIHAPLAAAGVTKEMVGKWWAANDFDLRLPNVGGVTPLGNCILCPLKQRAKLVNALRVLPAAADWWIGQEDRMARVIENSPRRTEGSAERRHRFFKDGTSYRDLLAQAAAMNAEGAPMDEGYDQGIDCLCTD